VAHRNFVSVFDLGDEQWTHYPFSDTVRYLSLTTRNNKIDKSGGRGNFALKYVEKYKVVAIVGSNLLYQFRKEDGKFEIEKERVLKTTGVIRRCLKQETHYMAGVFVLISD